MTLTTIVVDLAAVVYEAVQLLGIVFGVETPTPGHSVAVAAVAADVVVAAAPNAAVSTTTILAAAVAAAVVFSNKRDSSICQFR